MSEIRKHILFICAVFHSSLSKFALRKPFWNAIERHILKAITPLPQPKNDGKESTLPVTTEHMSALERQLILDLFSTFFTSVKNVKSCCMIEKDENETNDPVVDVLEKACMVFIGCFNSYLSRMDGLFVDDYGIIKTDELRIENLQNFSEILSEAIGLNFLPRKIKRVAENYLHVMNDSVESDDAAGEERI